MPMNFSTTDSTTSIIRSVIVRKDYTDTDLTSNKIGLIVFMSVMNVFMFFGNTLSIVTICSTPKLRQQVSYWFVLNLAIIDLIISVIVVPLNSVWEYYGIWPLSKFSCQLFTFADMTFSTISAYSIVLVSIDKYIYVTYAIQYYQHMTRRCALIMIVSVWVFVSIFSTVWLAADFGTDTLFEDHFLELSNGTRTCVYILTDNYIIPSVILSFFAPLLVLSFTSSRIVCIASRHLRTIHAFGKGSTSSTYSDRYSTTRARGETEATSLRRVHHSSGATMNTDCSNRPDTAQVNEADKEQPKYEEIGNGESVKQTQIQRKPVIIIDTIDQHNKEEFKHCLHSLWTKFRHTKSKQINNNCDNSAGFEGNNQIESVNMSGNTQGTANDDTIPTVSRQVHHTLSLTSTVSNRSTLSRTALGKRRFTISAKPLKPYCKLFGTVTIVIICFVVMFAPFNIAIIVDVTCHCVEPWIYEDILSVLYYMHSLVNPYIYMATDRKYKAALKFFWKRVKTKFSRQSKG